VQNHKAVNVDIICYIHRMYACKQPVHWLLVKEHMHVTVVYEYVMQSAANTELNSKIKIGHDDSLALCSGQTEKNTTFGAHFSIAKCVCLHMYVCTYVCTYVLCVYLCRRSVNKVMRLPAYRTIWQYCGLALHMKIR